MITGVHTLIYTKDPEGARALFRDVFKFHSVDAGGGWLIFRAPPGELACHPVDGDEGRHEAWFMCDDIRATLDELANAGVKVSDAASDRGWGIVSWFLLPGGEKMNLYQPKHPTAI